MSWSHFTTLLAAGDFITEAQRNELYDAFLERAAAVGPWSSITYAASSDLRTGGFATDLIECSSGGPVRLVTALSTIAQYFWRPETIDGPATLVDVDDDGTFLVFDPTDPTSLFYLACAEAGVSTAEFIDLDNEPTLNAWKRWNVIREAIRLLVYPRVKSGTLSIYNTQVTDTTWADAKAQFFLYPEISGLVGGTDTPLYLRAFYTGDYNISASRGEVPLSIPAITAFSSGYRLYGIFGRGANDTENAGITVNYNGGATSFAGYPLETDRQAYAISAAGRTVTGTQTLEYGMYGYFGSGAMDTYEVDPTNTEKVGEAYLHGIAAAPTFTYS